MPKIIPFLFCVFLATSLSAQNISAEEYIEQYKDIAIREMKRMGVPAAITLAQGLLETQNGNSDLVKKSNNHFGIKCKSSWSGSGVSHNDDAPDECFRVYKNAEESFRDHSNFLRGREHYAFLFGLDPADYKGWAKGLRKAGYATNPKYPEILINNIEKNNLQQYTLLAINEIPHYDGSKYKDDPEEKIVAIEDDAEFAGNDQVQLSEINGSKVIVGTKGKSLLAIATENKINLNKLLEMNDLETDGILEKDEIIFLEKKSRIGAQDFAIALENESLRHLAQRCGVQLQSICEYNHLDKRNILHAGTKVFLKPVLHQEESNSQAETDTSAKTHKVLPKEGLYSISKRYHVTVEELKKWNRLDTDNLSAGQELIVSK
ncbi:glucosaminidase domain-containing protein [soil metagenome]